VAQGTLLVNGTQGANIVVLGTAPGAPRATFGGAGTVGNLVVRSGILDPGSAANTVGVLTASTGFSITTSSAQGAARTFHLGRNPFELHHRYVDDAPSGTSSDDYIVRFSWGDGSEVERSDSRLVTVNNVAPAVQAGGDAATAGGLARSGFFVDPGVDRW